MLVVDHVGFSGRTRLPAHGVRVDDSAAFADRGSAVPPGAFSRQWGPHLAQPVPGVRLLLSGVVSGPCSAEFVRDVVGAVTTGRYDRPARLGGELSGCVITDAAVYLFRGAASRDQVFYRRSGTLVEWSADPSDLYEGGLAGFDRETLWRSCRGEEIFVYPDVEFVRPGHLVILDARSTRIERYERIVPLDLPRRTGLREYSEIAYELLLRTTRPYADAGPVGVLLSGGIDSSLVLAALVENGADVTAYHMGTEDPRADESAYAEAVCRHLSVRLVSVTTDLDDYFSTDWEFPHPYNHVWFRRILEIADRMRMDGICLALSGLEADILFGPLRYGLDDVVFGEVRWREKRQMLLGLLCSRWELGRVARSLARAYSLFDDAEATAEVAPGVDFLAPLPEVPAESYDLDFLPQEQTLNLTVWRPRGITLASPWGSPSLRRLAARIPQAYKLIPYRGRLIDKPVLRLAAADRLPELVWRHYGRNWLASPEESWCLDHPGVLAELLGGPGSLLVAKGVVDPNRLDAVLTDPAALRRNAESLVNSAMVELFLRSAQRRGAPDGIAATHR